MNERHDGHNETQMTCGLSFESKLPLMNTTELKSAKKRFRPADVGLDELLECEVDMALGMKTATQTSLIMKYEEDFKAKEIMRGVHKEAEKKLDYESSIQSTSKMSLPNVMSRESKIQQNDLAKQYASNNSNVSKPNIFIADSQDCSVNSEHLGGKKKAFEHPVIPPLSVKSKQSLIFPHANEQYSLVLSQENSVEAYDKIEILDKPPNDSINMSGSLAGKYERYLKHHDPLNDESPYARGMEQ